MSDDTLDSIRVRDLAAILIRELKELVNGEIVGIGEPLLEVDQQYTRLSANVIFPRGRWMKITLYAGEQVPMLRGGFRGNPGP